MFLFNLLYKLADYEVDVRWFVKGKIRKSVIGDIWNLPWYLYFRKVAYIDFVYDTDGKEKFWIIEVK